MRLTLGEQDIYINPSAPHAPHVIRAAALAALCRFKLAAENDQGYEVCDTRGGMCGMMGGEQRRKFGWTRRRFSLVPQHVLLWRLPTLS